MAFKIIDVKKLFGFFIQGTFCILNDFRFYNILFLNCSKMAYTFIKEQITMTFSFIMQ